MNIFIVLVPFVVSGYAFAISGQHSSSLHSCLKTPRLPACVQACLSANVNASANVNTRANGASIGGNLAWCKNSTGVANSTQNPTQTTQTPASESPSTESTTTTPTTTPKPTTVKYRLFVNKNTWRRAVDFCKSKKMQIATIRSEEEDKKALTELQGIKDGRVWIGMKKVKNGKPCSKDFYKWDNGSGPTIAPTYENWLDIAPRECAGCVQYWRTAEHPFKWDDNDCSHKKSVLCEYDRSRPS